MLIYIAKNADGTVEWVDLVPVDKFGKNADEAMASFLSYITWMDQW